LAAQYSAPDFYDAADAPKEIIDVGRLRQRDIANKNSDRGLVQVGKLDIVETIDNMEEEIVGKVKWPSRRPRDSVPTLEVGQEMKKQEELHVELVTGQEINMEEIPEQQQQEAAEEKLTTLSIPQIEEVKGDESVIDTKEQQDEQSDVVSTENGVDQEELPAKEEIIVPVPLPQEEELSTKPITKRRCLLLLALLVIVTTIIGIAIGTSSSSKSDHDVLAMQPPLVNVSSRCPGTEKYVSIYHHMQQSSSSSSSNGTDTRTRRVQASQLSVATWSIKDSCSGEVLIKCQPCLFSDEGNVTFEFIEKQKRIGSPDFVDRDMCIPDSHEYLFEVRKTDGTDEDRCCNFDVTTFYVTFDDVTVVDSSTTTIDIDSGVVSISLSDSGPCPTVTASLSPSVFPTLTVLPLCQFCPYCRWLQTNFSCKEREEYMVEKHKLSWEEAPISVMNTGECIDHWCGDCVWSSANDTSSTRLTCKEMLAFTLSNNPNANEGIFKRDTVESGVCKQVSDCIVERSIFGQPEAQCIAAGEDLNLCIAIDLSGSLCNRGTGYKCEGCFPDAVCNSDGVDLKTCCGNFQNVKEFVKLLISVFGSIPSEQSYSIVGFATNTSFVSDLSPTLADTFTLLDSLVYTGGVTNHAAAMSSCQQTLSDPDAVERKSMIILITDGNPTEPEDTAKEDAMAAASLAKEAGYIVIPVMLTRTSIDNNTIKYMKDLSSDGLFFNTSLSGLGSLEESLLSKVMC